MFGRSVRWSSRSGVDRPCQPDVVVGGYYQIYHDELPSEAPFWLKSINVVMVSDRNRLKLTVRFPSLNSLQTAEQTCSCPVLDMWLSMGEELARRVLRCNVSSPDFDNVDDFKAYWLLDDLAPNFEHKEVSPKYLCSSPFDSKEVNLDEIVNKEVEIMEVKEKIADADIVGKDIQQKKRRKYWPDHSLEAGKHVILNILKGKRITPDNPISRSDLRKEGRRQIGNTGLLDHLLKDLPGKIAPDGTSRFQRCYNVDGVTMYWLENADFVLTRQEAGVADPFWIPPTGWKTGSCTSGCTCSKELELLKEDAERIKRELEDTKKQLNDVLANDNTSNGRCSDYSKWVGGYW